MSIVRVSCVTVLIGLLMPSYVRAQPLFTVSTETELKDAIAQVVSSFARGDGSGPHTITLGADLTLTASLPSLRTQSPGDGSAWLTIDGGGHAIDANDTGRLFVIADGTVQIHDLRIRNAHARGGPDLHPAGQSRSPGRGRHDHVPARAGRAPIVKTFRVLAAHRFNVAITGPGSDVPELANEAFGARLDATQPIVVERSLYGNANGVTWAAGTNATATRLP